MDKIIKIFNFIKIKDFFSILNKDQKKSFITLIIFIFFNAILEMIGVGIIFPFLKLITQDQFSFLGINFYNNNNNLNLFILLVLGIMVFYFLKNLITTYISFRQSKFIFYLLYDLSSSLYSLYLNRPYKDFINDNTSRLIKNILNETRNATDFYIKPILIFFSELLLIIIIFILLIIIEPIGSLIILFFFGLFLTFYNIISKNIVNNWGLNSHIQEQKRLKLLQEGFGSIKSIYLRKHQDQFLKIYNQSTLSQMESNKLQDFVLTILKYWLEFVLIIGVFCFITFELFSMENTGEIKEIIPKLGLFMLAALRLLPSLNRLQGSIQNINFSKAFIENIITEKIKSLNIENNPRDRDNYSNNQTKINNIKLKNLTFAYDTKNDVNFVFKNLNINFKKGELNVIYGESGSGKSTLIDLVSGLIMPKSGNIYYNDDDISKDYNYWKSFVSFVPQNIFLLDDTVYNNIVFFENKNLENTNIVKNLVSICSLDDLIEERGLDFRIGENGQNISGGQKQRIAIARALFCEPQILILDEPTSALDDINTKKIFKLLNEIKKDVIVIIITHDKEIISKCDKLFNLEKIKNEKK